MIALFDLINLMFTNRKKYLSLSDNEKGKNFFMVNRLFSIKYPKQAQMFNHLRTPSAKVVDCWSWVAMQNNRVPTWFYTKTKQAKKKEEPKKKNKKKGFDPEKYEPSDEILEKFLRKKELSKKEYEQGLKFNHDKVKEILYDFEQRTKVV
jgi:hypothetical protein